MAKQPAESRVGQHTLIVTPTYNERSNLQAFVEQSLAATPAAHILVVDDASPDGTGALADSLAQRDNRISVLHRPKKLGLGTAYVQGFTQGLRRGYEVFVEMDTDLSHDPADLPRLLTAIDQGADVAVGSRNVSGGAVRGWGPGRHMLSKGGSLYSRWVLGVPIRDLTTGYKAYTRHAIETIELPTIRSNGYSFQIETTYRALQAGLNVVEVPIVFFDRRAGQSKMDGRIFLEAVGMVWKLRFQALKRSAHSRGSS